MTVTPPAQDTAHTLQASLERPHAAFHGMLLEPGHEGYDAARAVHNGLIDKRPRFIVRCVDTHDVILALELARTLSLDVSIRGGGHNVAGRAVVDDGIMIDLSGMKVISVDASARTATVEAGATWADMNAATLAHGLATTGGVIGSTGVAGLTLGGGLGWLMALHGLAIDNLLSADIVTADGKVMTANEHEHPDLFWALRGGGGNFGVVTRFTFQLHPIHDSVMGGLIAHPLVHANDMLRFFRDTTAHAPDEVTLFGGLLHAPDGSGHKIGAMIGFHPDAVRGADALQQVTKFGAPIMNVMGPMTYGQLNSMLDDGFPRGALNYWKSSFLTELSDNAIKTLIAQFEACPAPMGAMLLEHFHGAVTRVPVNSTAFPHREEGYNLLIAAQWMDPAQSEECIAWARAAFDAMQPFMRDATYMNYLGADAADGAIAAAYGSNFERLQKVKAKYDPTNLFHINQNIPPHVPTNT